MFAVKALSQLLLLSAICCVVFSCKSRMQGRNEASQASSQEALSQDCKFFAQVSEATDWNNPELLDQLRTSMNRKCIEILDSPKNIGYVAILYMRAIEGYLDTDKIKTLTNQQPAETPTAEGVQWKDSNSSPLSRICSFGVTEEKLIEGAKLSFLLESPHASRESLYWLSAAFSGFFDQGTITDRRTYRRTEIPKGRYTLAGRTLRNKIENPHYMGVSALLGKPGANSIRTNPAYIQLSPFYYGDANQPQQQTEGGVVSSERFASPFAFDFIVEQNQVEEAPFAQQFCPDREIGKNRVKIDPVKSGRAFDYPELCGSKEFVKSKFNDVLHLKYEDASIYVDCVEIIPYTLDPNQEIQDVNMHTHKNILDAIRLNVGL